MGLYVGVSYPDYLLSLYFFTLNFSVFPLQVSQKLLDEIQLANQLQNRENNLWDSDTLSLTPSYIGNSDDG